MNIQEVIIKQDIEFWERLLIDLGVEEIRILELIHQNQTLSLDYLLNKLRINYKLIFCKNKVRKILFRLKGFGLIKIVKSNPMFINEVIGIEENIKKLVFLAKERYKLK